MPRDKGFCITVPCMNSDSSPFLLPDWPAPPWVRALCTTRAGGCSHPPYEGLNLGLHVGDEPADVRANRRALARAMGAEPVFVEQVHGTGVQELHAADAGAECAYRVDATYTSAMGVGCAMMVADCLPVLLAHRSLPLVGAAHAGWRGLAGGVVEHLLDAMRSQAHTHWPECATDALDSGWMAWLGPCIGPESFEVGDEVRQAFLETSPGAVEHFRPGAVEGKWWGDLAGLARQRLRRQGIDAVHGNDSSECWSTTAHPERWYSYRRQNSTGRFAALVWLDAQAWDAAHPQAV